MNKLRWRPFAAGLAMALIASTASAFDLQGHRGARGLAPENTLESFKVALAHGVTTLELDIAITRDGVPVIHHDLALNPAITRDEAGRWLEAPSAPIHTLSLADVQRHDVGRLKPGTRYAQNHPDQVPADGTRIPRLADLFAMVKASGNDQVRFAIETKLNPTLPDHTLPPEAFVKALLAEIDKAGLRSRVQILSFDWRTLQVVQQLAPGIPTVYITAQQSWLDNVKADAATASPWTAGFSYREHRSIPRMIKAAGGHVWSVYHGDIDAAKVKEAQSLGLKVLVWTVNDAATMGRMIDLGVDGLVTDRPDIARKVLAARQITPR